MDFPSLSSFKSIYTSNPLVILDTNIYLDLLRYSKIASSEMLGLLQSISAYIFVPEQVKSEFAKNFPIVNSQRIGDIKSANTVIKQAVEICKTDIQKQFNLLIKRRFEGSQEIAEKVSSDFQRIKSDIDEYISKSVLCNETVFLSENEVDSFFSSLCSSNTYQYTPSKLLEIYKDGYIRYKYKIPPGYMDDPQNNTKSKKEGTEIFGDLVLWNQIIDAAKSQQRAVIFVTADSKEDWFKLRNDYPLAPRYELINEFEEKTEGNTICILTNQLFIEYLSSILSVNMDMVLLEMQMDDFVDITVRNNQSKILDYIIQWANKDENILQFPFVDEVNKLIRISNPRLLVKNVAVQTGTNIKYLALLNGTADFVGVFYDDEIKRYTSHEQEASFLFDIRISLVRDFTEGDGERKPSKDITDIAIDGATFEVISTIDIPLESKRGIFIVPNENDQNVYDYMHSIWDSYEKKYSVDVAEAFVFFDAANHFGCSLLEINRSFTLVQNKNSKLNLSLNEIDAIALKRFSDINISIGENGNASFRSELASLGNIYPTPESMLTLDPEQGKELSVKFSCELERPDGKYAQVKGKTNLPIDTQLMISLHSKERFYRAQSKVSVQKDGTFVSDVFSDSKNENGNSLRAGLYKAEITVPIVSVQPDSVKIIMGKKGRNLIGEFVTNDSIMGKTVNCSSEFELE